MKPYPKNVCMMANGRKSAGRQPVRRRVVLWGVTSNDVSHLIAGLADWHLLLLPADEAPETVAEHLGQFNNAILICGTEVISRLLDQCLIKKTNAQVTEVGRERLRQRDHELLNLLHAGLSNKEIGLQLKVSERTVKGYLTRLFAIFEVTNRTELLGSAMDLGILRPRKQDSQQ